MWFISSLVTKLQVCQLAGGCGEFGLYFLALLIEGLSLALDSWLLDLAGYGSLYHFRVVELNGT